MAGTETAPLPPPPKNHNSNISKMSQEATTPNPTPLALQMRSLPGLIILLLFLKTFAYPESRKGEICCSPHSQNKKNVSDPCCPAGLTPVLLPPRESLQRVFQQSGMSNQGEPALSTSPHVRKAQTGVVKWTGMVSLPHTTPSAH